MSEHIFIVIILLQTSYLLNNILQYNSSQDYFLQAPIWNRPFKKTPISSSLHNLEIIHTLIKIHHLWKIITLMTNYHFDENSSSWWNFITLIKMQVDENSSLWWKCITLMHIHHFDKINCFDENLLLWWKFISLMKMHSFNENDQLW